MILHRLDEYYHRLVERGERIPLYGYQLKELPFIVVLEKDGCFAYLEDTRQKEGKKLVAKRFLVPAERSRSGKNAWKTANILWDHPGYLFGLNPKNPQMGKLQHQSFLSSLVTLFGEVPEDEGVSATMTYLKAGDFSDIVDSDHWPEIEKRMPFISFRLRGSDRLVCQSDWVRNRLSKSKGQNKTSFCPISGHNDSPARLHPKIKGIIGAQSSGASLVSFNLSAFESYGKKQGDNAPIGEHAAFGYATALNWLLSQPRHRLRLGETTVVFWAQEEHRSEDLMSLIFAPGKIDSDSDEKVRSILSAPRSGLRPEEGNLPFYVLGLSPNAARLSVRFWYEGSLGEMLAHIVRYFDDLAIVKQYPDDPEYPTLGHLLLSTALEYKWDNVPPNLTGAFFLSILQGTRYPEPLLSATLRRIRAEGGHVTYPRAALLKALLIRNHHKEITMSLDLNRTEAAYQLGRLFAVLEHLQSSAHGSLNASIRDRYYGSASSTPIAVFPTLLKLSAHHLGKIDNPKLVTWYEKQIGEIMNHLQEWPAHLPLKEQALFALGYYHQKQKLYTKKGDQDEQSV